MYRLKVKDSEYTIPQKNLVMFAMFEAMQRGKMRGEIVNDITAIGYLESIGFEVSKCEN